MPLIAKTTRATLERAARRIAVGLLLMVGPVIGCDDGYSYSTPFFGGSSGFASSSSSGVVARRDAGQERCQTVAEGDDCFSRQVQTGCEQGPSANLQCNARLVCDDGVWVQEEPQRAVCAPLAACPATYTERDDDALCQRPDAISLICEYDEGTCGCAPVGGIPIGVPGLPGKKDAGDAGDAGDDAADASDGSTPDAGPRTYEWRCIQPKAKSPDCPRRRPREGVECVREMDCDYGYCIFEDGFQMTCERGSWARTAKERDEACDQ